MTFQELLKSIDACQDAKDWASEKTWEEAYRDCPRGDWMLWLFQKTNPDNLKELTLAKGHCANTVKNLMKDERSVKAVDTAIAFGEGKATTEELNVAASASTAASAASAYAASAYAASAAADAAYAAAYAAYAAAFAASASAASASASAAARKENLQLTADICRKYLPIEIWNIK